MDLWIRSQNRRALYCVRQLRINGLDIMCLGGELLGTYKSKERTLEVLDEIDEFIDLFNRKGFGNVLSDDGVHSKHTIYEMPLE